LSEKILQGEFKAGDKIRVEAEEDKIKFTKVRVRKTQKDQ